MSEFPFSDGSLKLMELVETSSSSDFVHLCKIAGLNPKTDFVGSNLREIDIRGCDLTGFDLRGSDLTGALVSQSTLLPAKEFLVGAKVDTIYADDRSQIVEVMQAIEVSNSKDRSFLLKSLIREYDSDAHIDLFALNKIRRTKDAIEAQDYFNCISLDFMKRNERQISTALAEVISAESARRPAKKKVAGRHPHERISSLIGAIAESELDKASYNAAQFRRGDLSLEDFVKELRSVK